MKTRLAALVLALVGAVSAVQADIPGPRPKPPVPAPPVVADKSVPLVYEMADGNGPAKLIIPKKFAGQMKAAIDLHSPDAVAENPPSRTPAMLAGLFLTLSLAFTGLWVVRSRGLVGGRTVALVLAGVALLGLGSALLWANAPPPPNLRPAPVNNGDRVIIEIVEQGDAVKMILPKNRIAGLVPAPQPIPFPVPPGVKPPIAVPSPNLPPGVKPAPVPQPAPAKPVDGGLNGAFAPGQPGIAVAVPVQAQPILIKD